MFVANLEKCNQAVIDCLGENIREFFLKMGAQYQLYIILQHTPR